jgi:predicted alpha/beta-fold hydrolase
MLRHLFRLTMFLIFLTAMMVLVTPVLTVNSLLYPIRTDSASVMMQQISFEKQPPESRDSTRMFLYSPRQLQLNYVDYQVTLPDGDTLRGWLVLDSLRSLAPLLLIIPDISEGAISYIPALKEFADRGFNVCVLNMRGQGNSDGEMYDMTQRASNDLRYAVRDLKKIPFIEKVAVMGIRTGAAITIKAFSDSSRFADVMILQNPPLSLQRYFVQHVISDWGRFMIPVIPALKRAYEEQTSIQMEHYDYRNLLVNIFVPHMLVAANYPGRKIMDETVALYHESNYYRKRLLIDTESAGKPPGFSNSKKYYDRISAFINYSLPPTTKKSRFRKLAEL